MSLNNWDKVPLRKKKDYRGLINLSSNEMFSNNLLLDIQQEFINYLSSYKNMLSQYIFIEDIRDIYAQLLNIKNKKLIFTAGSDSAIFYILLIYRSIFKKVILQYPNYINYDNYSTLIGYDIQYSDLSFLSIKQKVMYSDECIVVITNPNGFTGETWKLQEFIKIVQLCKHKGHVLLVDLAYSDFSKQKMLPYLYDEDHVIFIKTWSKSYAAAGIRIAEVIANEDTCIKLKKLGIENSLSQMQLAYIKFVIQNTDSFKKIILNLLDIKNQLINTLNYQFPGVYVYNSTTNFITVKFSDYKQYSVIKTKLDKASIIVKDLSNFDNLLNTLRITVSDIATTDTIIKIFSEAYA